jgi:peptidoglycan/xylan/chitin deacetylase (PgdA/CDA1 family)
MNRIINFHDAHDKSWIERILLHLSKKYSVISIAHLEKYLKGEKVAGRFCLITIDDGDLSFYEVVYPLLKKYNLPATLFVSPKVIMDGSNYWFQDISSFDPEKLKRTIADYLEIESSVLRHYNIMHVLKNLKIDQIKEIIGLYRRDYHPEDKSSQNLNLSQLKEIVRDGLVVVGAHTLNHPVLANEEANTSENEISESIALLESITGTEVRYFAYPNGIPDLDFGEREKATLAKCGCKLAFSTLHKPVRPGIDPLCIPRFYVSSGSLNAIRVKLYLGETWNVIRSIKIKGEEQSRRELHKLMNISV